MSVRRELDGSEASDNPTEQQGEPEQCGECGADLFEDENAKHEGTCDSCYRYWNAIDRGINEERDEPCLF